MSQFCDMINLHRERVYLLASGRLKEPMADTQEQIEGYLSHRLSLLVSTYQYHTVLFSFPLCLERLLPLYLCSYLRFSLFFFVSSLFSLFFPIRIHLLRLIHFYLFLSSWPLSSFSASVTSEMASLIFSFLFFYRNI